MVQSTQLSTAVLADSSHGDHQVTSSGGAGFRFGRATQCLLVLLAAVAGLAAASAVAGRASAGKTIDLTGTWQCCGGGGSPQVWVITAGTGSISGIAKLPGGRVFAALSGSVSGGRVTIVATYNDFDPGYVGTAVGTVSADGSSMSGTWTSNRNHQTGTWSATREGQPPTTTSPQTTTTQPTTTETSTTQTTTSTSTEPSTTPSVPPSDPTEVAENTQNADDCEAKAADDNPGQVINGTRSIASVSRLHDVLVDGRTAFDYQPSDGILTTIGKTYGKEINLVEYCTGGLIYAGGSLADGVGTGAMWLGGAALVAAPIAGATGNLPASGSLATAGVIGLSLGALTAYSGGGWATLGKGMLDDPPDPHFRKIAVPAAVTRPALPSATGKVRTALQTLAAAGFTLLQANAVRAALITTINRVGSARKAGDTAWEGRQMRTALAYDYKLRVILHRFRDLLPEVNKVLAGSMFHTHMTAAEAIAAKKLAATGRLPANLVRVAVSFGVSKPKLEAVILRLPDKSMTGSPPPVLASPNLVQALKFEDASLSLYTRLPQIIRESKLT